MSVTKHENNEGELMSTVDVTPEKVSNKSSRCSCLNCDSLTCFKKRNKAVKDVCQCAICRDLKNCLSVTQKASKENKVGDPKENIPKKFIRETVTKETIKSLKKVTETMYEVKNIDSYKIITEKPSKINKDKPKDYGTIEKIIKNVANCQKDTDNINKTDKNKCCKQLPITQGPSSAEFPKKDDNTVTKLSAQVMRVPYDELNKSASSNQILEKNPLPKLNIFERIKEIYDACSCKVCECISSKPLQDPNICQCKPCDCHDYTKLQRKIDENIRRLPHSGCPCVRCDRENCQGVVKKTAELKTEELQICDCKPCECFQCTENVPKPCSCDSCQCIDSKTLNNHVQKTVKLAQQDEICECSPCECFDSKPVYGQTNTVMCTTGFTRYHNCQCEICCSERCQFVDKEARTCERCNDTIQKVSNNFNIRTVIVNNKEPFVHRKRNIFENHDTISLFTTLKNDYSRNISSKSVCKCIDCECIVCAAKDEALKRERDNVLKSNVKVLQQAVVMPTRNMNSCTCSPCECEICSQKLQQDKMQIRCKCDYCDCLNCREASLPSCGAASKKKVMPMKFEAKMNVNCNCHLCECRNCNDLLSCMSNVKFYSDGKSFGSKTVHRQKKVTIVSPSLSTEYINSQKMCDESVSSITLNPKNVIYEQNIPTYYSTIQNRCAFVSHLRHNASDNQNYCNPLYETDNDLALDADLKFNTKASKKFSYTAVCNEPNINMSNNVQRNDFSWQQIPKTNTDKMSESKFKNINIIHETPVKTTNDSEESLPVFWIYSETVHPTTFSPDRMALTPSVDKNLKASSASIEKLRQDKETTSTHDCFLEYPSNDWDYNCVFNNKNDLLHLHEYSSSPQRNSNNARNEFPVAKYLDLNSSYRKATRVLQEAKAFSAKLIELLDSFEAANRNFKSSSQKFKNLHLTLIDINETEVKEFYNKTLTQIDTSKNKAFDEAIENIPCQVQVINENTAEKEYEQCTNNTNCHTNNIFNNSKAEDYNSVSKIDYDKLTTDSLPDISDRIKESTFKIIVKKDTDTEEFEKNYSAANKDENNITISDEVNKPNFSEQPVETQIANSSKEDAQTLSLVLEKLDSPFEKERVVDSAMETDDINQETNKKDYFKKGKRKKLDIFNKNLFLNDTPIKIHRKMFKSPTLEWNIKEAIQAISLQVPYHQDSPKLASKTNEALTNLQSEVSDLLKFVLQTKSQDKCHTEVIDDANKLELRDKLNSELKSTSSQTCDGMVTKADKGVYFNSDYKETIKSSCEDFKTKFVGLRRVSDHTVLVKWKLPKSIKDVQGYELLVDGRAVHKIFSPTRSIAVLSCLPNADRVLLTIRTILASVATADCDHANYFPATSIVYRPSNK